MKNLRTQYGNELGKVKASTSCGSGTIKAYIPTWKYYDQLQFLRDSITTVKTRPTPGISASLGDPRLVQVDVEEDEESLVSQTTFGTPKSAKSVAKVHRKMEDKVLEKSLSVLEDVTNKRKIPMEEDGDIIFGKHVCQSLKDIKDKRSKELVKLKIQQLLFEAQFGNNSQGTACNISCSWDSPYQQRLY